MTSARRAVRASAARDSAPPAKYRYVVVAPLTPLQSGDEFTSDAWPPHTTLVPPFSTMAPPAQLSNLVAAAVSGFAPVETRALERHSFGRRHDVPVTTLEATDQLRRLHETLLQVAQELALAPIDPEHVGEGYRPHVTRRENADLAPGAAVLLDTVAVVDQRPHADRRLRHVVSVEMLTG